MSADLEHGTHGAPPRCYVASSWRCERQPLVVAALRAAGVTCYDFKNPPSNAGFGWEQLALGHPKEWTTDDHIRALSHPVAEAGFRSDLNAIQQAFLCVMVQPCGRSAALELGYAAALGKRCAVLLAPGQEPELMLKVAEYFTADLAALVKWAASRPGL